MSKEDNLFCNDDCYGNYYGQEIQDVFNALAFYFSEMTTKHRHLLQYLCVIIKQRLMPPRNLRNKSSKIHQKELEIYDTQGKLLSIKPSSLKNGYKKKVSQVNFLEFKIR